MNLTSVTTKDSIQKKFTLITQYSEILEWTFRLVTPLKEHEIQF